MVLAGPARADEHCTPARALIVLDKSSSMVTGLIGGMPKWDIAVGAIDAVVTAHQSEIELGLMLFPGDAGECAPGEVNVMPGLGRRDAIMAALAAPPPQSGYWTPMAQTLDAVGASGALADASRHRYVVLVSDGWQWCSPYDPDTRLTPVGAVRRLKAMGITTYVVGFGDSVDPIALNLMAVEAGTTLMGCDPGGTTPTAANPCYYRADDASQLVSALDAIAVQVSAEVCGDGEDNDCDGETDEACECAPGSTQACGSDQGNCRAGTQTCGETGWSPCMGAVGPEAETCNGDDDDCDGQTDEGGVCAGPPMPDPPDNPGTGEMPSGCACDLAPRPALKGPLALLSMLAGTLLVLRKRR